ncbi:MAG: hypothetical protein CM1200mP9_02010 [Gammaproteobacteria bacterium]|nr:MAG: hypothetical protein CM1200mP9_02010 [Gammaproteobacteria bacterium]
MVEGQWPYDQQADGFLVIERFDSKQAFLDFWYSDEYQAAIELRKGKVELDSFSSLKNCETPAAMFGKTNRHATKS